MKKLLSVIVLSTIMLSGCGSKPASNTSYYKPNGKPSNAVYGEPLSYAVPSQSTYTQTTVPYTIVTTPTTTVQPVPVQQPVVANSNYITAVDRQQAKLNINGIEVNVKIEFDQTRYFCYVYWTANKNINTQYVYVVDSASIVQGTGLTLGKSSGRIDVPAEKVKGKQITLKFLQ